MAGGTYQLPSITGLVGKSDRKPWVPWVPSSNVGVFLESNFTMIDLFKMLAFFERKRWNCIEVPEGDIKYLEPTKL